VNVRDWCADEYLKEGPSWADGTNVVPGTVGVVSGVTSARVHRGGGWDGSLRNAGPAGRFRLEPGSRIESLGFRVAFRSSAQPA
jgi:formylglycine-generating enzyme required for sulfatase activity